MRSLGGFLHLLFNDVLHDGAMPLRMLRFRALCVLRLVVLALIGSLAPPEWVSAAVPTAADILSSDFSAVAGTDARGSAMPAMLCRGAIASAETTFRIPDLFLSAIGRVESGRPLPLSGQVAPWPWTVDAEGQGHFYPSKQSAMEAVQALQARGVRSIDVGCLQVNLEQHPDAFASLDQAFDPQANASFAARLLSSLFVQTGSWPLAAAAYHSQTPAIGAAYQQKVLSAWAAPDRPTDSGAASERRQAAAPPRSFALSGAQSAGPPSVGRTITSFSRRFRTGEAQSPHGRTLDDYRKIPVAVALRPRRAPS
jgi:hypothetical protein